MSCSGSFPLFSRSVKQDKQARRAVNGTPFLRPYCALAWLGLRRLAPWLAWLAPCLAPCLRLACTLGLRLAPSCVRLGLACVRLACALRHALRHVLRRFRWPDSYPLAPCGLL